MSRSIILCLGGNYKRNITAASLASSKPNSIVLVSSEGNPGAVADIYRQANVSLNRVFFDFRAWDTLTNFTLTLPWILDHQCTDLMVVTDQFHIRRAMTIADIVYFTRGLSITEHPHPSTQPDESRKLIAWDAFRSWIWKTTGKTIENGDRVERMKDINAFKAEAISLGLQVT
jgi:hypothetical protein